MNQQLSAADESWLSSMSAILESFTVLCQHCTTKQADLISLSNGRTGLAVTHEPGCPLADD